MSLVNDALKRAKEAHDRQAATPIPGAPLHTATPPRRSSNGIVLLLAGLGGLALLAALVIGGGVLLFMRISAHSTPAPREPHLVQAAAPINHEAVRASRPPEITNAPPPPAPPAPPEVVVVTPPPVAPPPVAPPPVAPMDFRLQGILYSAGKSEAIVNGRTVRVGSRVSDATISAIEPDRVTILYNNQPIVIRLPR